MPGPVPHILFLIYGLPIGLVLLALRWLGFGPIVSFALPSLCRIGFLVSAGLLSLPHQPAVPQSPGGT